jgi:hypothetical protein
MLRYGMEICNGMRANARSRGQGLRILRKKIGAFPQTKSEMSNCRPNIVVPVWTVVITVLFMRERDAGQGNRRGAAPGMLRCRSREAAEGLESWVRRRRARWRSEPFSIAEHGRPNISKGSMAAYGDGGEAR